MIILHHLGDGSIQNIDHFIIERERGPQRKRRNRIVDDENGLRGIRNLLVLVELKGLPVELLEKNLRGRGVPFRTFGHFRRKGERHHGSGRSGRRIFREIRAYIRKRTDVTLIQKDEKFAFPGGIFLIRFRKRKLDIGFERFI